MNKQKDHIEFSSKIVGIITAIIALLSVIGAFYNNLNNYVEAKGYFTFFSIDLRYIDINFYSNSYNFILLVVICLLQFADAFFAFNLLRRIRTNRNIEIMVKETEVEKDQQKKLNEIFYINHDSMLSFIDIFWLILFFIAIYILQILLSNKFDFYNTKGLLGFFDLKYLLSNILTEIGYVLMLFIIHTSLVEKHFVLPDKITNNIEVFDKILKVNKSSDNGKEFVKKLKDINSFAAYERILANARLSIVSLIFVIGLLICVELPISYFNGANKAKLQKEFWITEKGVVFQIDSQNYMILGCEISENKDGESKISINPNQIEIIGISGIIIEKKRV